MTSDLVRGDDGLLRCPWGASAPDYERYHDTEWGVPVHGDVAIFERLTLEAFQSGLSWLTILRKRESFRSAFDGFAIETVAAYGARRARAPARRRRDRPEPGQGRRHDHQRARRRRPPRRRGRRGPRPALLVLRAHRSPPSSAEPLRPRRRAPPSRWPWPRALKKRGFVFVGPTTMYAAMQAMGLVDDHLRGLPCRPGCGLGASSAIRDNGLRGVRAGPSGGATDVTRGAAWPP